MDKIFDALDLTTVCVSDINQTKKIWEDHVECLKKYLSPFLVLDVTKESPDLQNLKFLQSGTYYFHPCLSGINNQKWFQLLIKIAMFDNISTGLKCNISQFIYAKDKKAYIEARNAKQTTRDRFDKFMCRFAFSKPSGSQLIRHCGTAHGQSAYSSERRSGFRESNKEFLHGLMYGFTVFNMNRRLICPMEGTQCEKVPKFNTDTMLIEFKDCYEIHHARFDQTGSIYKTVSPSEYINKSDFRDYSQEVLEEFLGCIVLSENSHGIVHDSPTDGLDGWFARRKYNACFYIPYHWISKANYNETLKYLESVCKNFKAAKALTYAEFKKKHSRPSVPQLSQVTSS